MSPLLLAVALAVGADEGRGDAAGRPHVEGRWLIVYAEEGGRRNNAWEQRQATVQGNTLSYSDEGKMHSVRLTFGPHQTLRASFEGGERSGGNGGGEHAGVYIAGQDYLCISLTGGEGRGEGRREGRGERAGAGGERGHSSGHFILILRRQRGNQ
jgi:hypothetical protein